ncbi:hypothetical protein DAI22_03g033300 [Oryza sativa Japonica Group]|nr:hypothetical protein DAI22_03g033300 [Oryza sativa Japonica Group]
MSLFPVSPITPAQYGPSTNPTKQISTRLLPLKPSSFPRLTTAPLRERTPKSSRNRHLPISHPRRRRRGSGLAAGEPAPRRRSVLIQTYPAFHAAHNLLPSRYPPPSLQSLPPPLRPNAASFTSSLASISSSSSPPPQRCRSAACPRPSSTTAPSLPSSGPCRHPSCPAPCMRPLLELALSSLSRSQPRALSSLTRGSDPALLTPPTSCSTKFLSSVGYWDRVCYSSAIVGLTQNGRF